MPKEQFPEFADYTPRGDGSWIVRPKVIDADGWVTVAQAARLLNWCPDKVYSYLGDLLVYYRPLPTRIAVKLSSVRTLHAATLDPDFWDSKERKESLRKKVQKEMEILTDKALAVG